MTPTQERWAEALQVEKMHHPADPFNRTATIAIRTGEGWDARPGMLALNGEHVTLSRGWICGEGDHSAYQGERVWIIDRDCDIALEAKCGVSPVWLAEGDLKFD